MREDFSLPYHIKVQRTDICIHSRISHSGAGRGNGLMLGEQFREQRCEAENHDLADTR